MKIKKSLFQHLTTFLGILFVISGAMGLLAIQSQLADTQELRGRAAHQEVVAPRIYPININQDLYADEEGEISIVLETGGIKPTRVRTVFNIINSDLETPEIFVNLNSGFKAESLEVEQVDDGYLVSITALPYEPIISTQNNSNLQLSLTPFIQIKIEPENEGTLGINFDDDKSYLETQTLKYFLETTNAEFNIVNKDDGGGGDDDGGANDETETPQLQQCGQTCQSNADCDVNLRCFDTGSQKVCRLVRNVSSPTCEAKSDQQTTTTTQQPESVVSNCGESCNTNADCDINLRCYQSECRLVTNPSSLTCSVTTTTTASTVYGATTQATATQSELDDDQKGSRLIPEEDLTLREIAVGDITATGATFEGENFADETLLELIQKMLEDNEQRLPILVIISGLVLLFISILMFAANKVRTRNNS
jgi:hypothetical protein